MRKWIGSLGNPLPLSSLSTEEKLQKHLLFTYISAQSKYLRTSYICYHIPFHTQSALSTRNANYFENFHIDKRCCIIWCLMIGNKYKMVSKRPVWHLLTRQFLKEVIFAMLAGEPGFFCCYSFYPLQQPIVGLWWVHTSVQTFWSNWGLIIWGKILK